MFTSEFNQPNWEKNLAFGKGDVNRDENRTHINLQKFYLLYYLPEGPQ